MGLYNEAMRINYTIFPTQIIKDETERRIKADLFFVDIIMLYNIYMSILLVSNNWTLDIVYWYNK